jgi:hypothetical protein
MSTSNLRAGNETETVAQLGRAIADLHSHLGRVESAYIDRCKEYEELQQFAEAATVERDQAQEQQSLTRSVVEAQRVRIKELETDAANLKASIELGNNIRNEQAAEIESLNKRLHKALKVKG